MKLNLELLLCADTCERKQETKIGTTSGYSHLWEEKSKFTKKLSTSNTLNLNAKNNET